LYLPEEKRDYFMPEYPGLIRSKLPKAGTTIFTVMSQLAAEQGAINLSQGFPDFAVDPDLIELVNESMKNGFNQYAPMQGLMALREEIAAKMEMMYSAKYNPETEINITSGGTQAIYAAITAVIKEGDEVIVFEPAYDCYVPAIELNGGIPVYIQLRQPDFHIDWNEVKKVINQRTRMIIINSPHNPSGAVLSARDMQQLEKITRDREILILSDEVYEHVIFDGLEHQSIARYPRLAERCFIVYSFGKTFHATGWKIGYCVAPAKLMAEFRKVHQFMVFCTNTPVQHALARFMKNPERFLSLDSFYQKKRDRFLSLLKDSRLTPRHTYGSYFQLLGFDKISQERDTDFAIHVTKTAGVASIPVSVFYKNPSDHKLLRFCFAKNDETLERAAEKLSKL
jgi:methionine transaminase